MDHQCVTTMLLLLTAFSKVSVAEMLTNDQTHIVNPGETLNLTCTFRFEDLHPFSTPTAWVKTQMGERVDISDTGIPNPPFKSTGRFHAQLDHESSPAVFSLIIYDIQPEDTGNYTCEVRNTALGNATHDVIVRVPVTNIYFSEIIEHSSSRVQDSMTFTEGRNNSIECRADGGFPPPHMELYMSCGSDPENRVNLTSLLHLTQRYHLDGEEGLRSINYETMRGSRELDMQGKYDSCFLLCEAYLPGDQHPNVISTYVQLTVHYAPRIKCNDTQAVAGERNLRISCVVKANPSMCLDERGVTWDIRVDEFNPGGYSDLFYRSDIQNTQENDTCKATLHVFLANKTSFKTYTLNAENMIGKDSYDVSLFEKPAPSLPDTEYNSVARSHAGSAEASSDADSLHGVRGHVGAVTLSALILVAHAFL